LELSLSLSKRAWESIDWPIADDAEMEDIIAGREVAVRVYVIPTTNDENNASVNFMAGCKRCGMTGGRTED